MAAKDPFSHRRRCPMSSAADSGTSVSALLGLTYVSVHFSFFLATSSKHRIRSSAVDLKKKKNDDDEWVEAE